jgi:hypothetical protein
MLIKAASFCLLFIVAFCILPFSAQTQFISSEIYETEEDLREGLEKGYLTLDQYLELLDMIQSKLRPSSRETDRLFFVPDVSSLDISQLKAKGDSSSLDQKAGAFLEEKKPEAGPLFSGKLIWKLYESFDQGQETENYLLCEVSGRKRLIWRIEADHEANSSEGVSSHGTLRVRKRFLKLLLPEYSSEVTVGNFDRRIGLGLNVGYHPLFGYSSGQDSGSEDTFLYPALGRYNGFCGESRLRSFSVSAFYSKNRRGEIENRVGALDLSFVEKRVQTGFCLSRGQLQDINGRKTFKDDCTSLHLELQLDAVRLSSEYALLSNKKSGVAFDLHSSRKRYSFNLSYWRYEDEFVHPHGGGISNPDYETIYLEEIDYNFRARQAGERGVFFKSRYRLFDKFSLNFSHSQWRERSYLQDKMKFRIDAGYRFSPRLSFTISQLWTDYDVNDEEIDRKTSSLNLSFSLHRKLVFNCMANYRSTDAKDYGDLRLKVRTRLLSPFDFILWLKYSDLDFSQSSDECFSFHLQEKVRFFENHFVSAEFIAKFYQDESKTDTRAARVRLEASW